MAPKKKQRKASPRPGEVFEMSMSMETSDPDTPDRSGKDYIPSKESDSGSGSSRDSMDMDAESEGSSRGGRRARSRSRNRSEVFEMSMSGGSGTGGKRPASKKQRRTKRRLPKTMKFPDTSSSDEGKGAATMKARRRPKRKR